MGGVLSYAPMKPHQIVDDPMADRRAHLNSSPRRVDLTANFILANPPFLVIRAN